jgi:hypothetical protein
MTTMSEPDFSWAMTHMRMGFRVRRTTWYPHKFIFLNYHLVVEPRPLSCSTTGIISIPPGWKILEKYDYSSNSEVITFQPWQNIHQEDLLESNWELGNRICLGCGDIRIIGKDQIHMDHENQIVKYLARVA